MGSESQGSTFWTNFYTIRKKNTTRESLWSRFHSPYDPIQRVESPVSSRFSGHRKAAELGDPVSPQSGRSRSLWSPKTWYPVQRVSRSALPSPRGTSAGSLKEERPAEIKLRTSRSAEILVDLCNGEENGCCRSGKRPPETSKSTDELVKVRNRWLEKLDQYKVSFSSSRSDDSLNLKLTKENWMRSCDQCGVMAIKSQPNLFSSLRRMRKIIRENPTPNPKKENFYISTDHSPRHEIVINKSPKPDQKCKDTSTKLDREKSADDGHRRCYRNESGEDGKVLLVSATPDHPALTVRPGYHLARSRSCPRSSSHSVSTCKEPSSPDSNSSIRSSGCSLGTSERTHEDRTQRSRSSKRSTTSESVVKDKESLVLEHTPRIPALKINKYNLKTCFARVDQRKTLSLCNHLPARNLEQVFAQEAERALNDNEMFALSTRKDPFESLNKTLSPRQRILRSTLKHRLRSEEKLALGHKSCLPQGQPPGRVFGNKTVLSPRASMVLGEDDSGLCSGVIFDGSTSARTGLFPASLVARRDTNVGGMSGRGKPAAAVKVSPPTVPDSGVTHRHSGSSFSSGVYSAGDQRSSYSSSVSDENPPASPRSPARGGVCDHGRLGSGGGGGTQLAGTNSSPSHYNNQQFTFPVPPHQQQVPQFAHLMCPKTSPGSPHHLPQDTTYYLTYQHQTSLEDQGIDVQSPGRSSPGSGSGSSTTGSTASSGGCRNSTTSLDSGRASTTTHSHQHRLSGQSYDSGSILRHSYHSSSSSLGSMEHDPATHVNVPELLNNGVRDSEVLGAWLTDLRFEEYYEKFISAGYDMPTISRMTPEDLNAIGITKPAHRKKLKAEITRLNISDGLPDFIPGRLEDWLSILRLEEYTASLRQQKYTSVEQMTQLTWEDLEDIGITKLGHQKKVMLAIKRVKDIMAGKKFTNTQDPRQQSHYGAHEIMISREASEGRDQYASVPEFRTFSGPGHYGNGEHNRLSGPADSGVHYGVQTHYVPGVQYGPMPPPPQAHVHPMSQQTGPFHPSNQFSAPQGPSPPGSKLANIPPHPLPGPGQVQYRPDLVAVQVRPGGRGRSIESLEEPIYGTYHTFHPDSRLQFVQGPMSLGSLPPRPFLPTSMGTPNPQRSMDDGDITPTNEYANNYEGGGTLPRPRTANKLRPVAKVTAKTRVDVHEVPQFIKDGMNLKKPSQKEEINMKDLNIKELNLKALNRQNSEKIYNTSQGTGSSNNTPQGTPKKIPPPPPRRSNSISETSKEAALQESQYGYLRRGLSYGYMGIKNNLQPDVTPDLPPPPAPPDSANHQHLPDDFPPPPPPLTCVTMASSTRITASSTITTSSITSDSLATSQTSTTSSEDDVSTGFRPRRNDSNASFKSTSSTDSESLPFANENAGTIKQRACRPHPGLTVLDTRNSPHSSPRSSPALRRKDAQPPLRQNPIANTESTGQIKSNSSSPDGTGDVLNDIGNMLANLTDELDAMLEQEVILKN